LTSDIVNNSAGTGRRIRPSGSGRGAPEPEAVDDDALPDITVEPDTFTVRIDGEIVEGAPTTELPMAQRYFLF
jgi:urease subunit alpha